MKTRTAFLFIVSLFFILGALYLIICKPTGNNEKKSNYSDVSSEIGGDFTEQETNTEDVRFIRLFPKEYMDAGTFSRICGKKVANISADVMNNSVNKFNRNTYKVILKKKEKHIETPDSVDATVDDTLEEWEIQAALKLDEFIREEHADYFMTHPIEIGKNAGTTQEKEMFYDIPRYILLCLDYDDYVHEIPFFYEDLGIKEHVWWIYDGKKVEPLNSVDDEYTFYFYYTTDYDLVEDFRENYNLSALDTMGTFEIFYSDWELKFLFRETRKEGKDQEINYQAEWIER